MQIYLPIAELSVNIFVLLALGGVTGLLAGLFGIGGGFLLTPLLIFIGVPPAVSVATSANQIIAATLSGFLAHLRRGNVDFRMGNALLGGGLAGSTLGVLLFRWLQSLGQIDLLISVAYVLFLSGIGGLMASESIRTIRGVRTVKPPPAEGEAAARWRDRLPMQTTFPRSGIRISLLMPIGIGVGVGMLVSLMGMSGGFFLVPAMIYLLGMPTAVVVGTSLYQSIFISANVTLLQAATNHTVDIVLAAPLLVGAVLGAQIGTRLGTKLPAEHLRGLLAVILLLVAVRLAYGLFAVPQEFFTILVGA